MGYDTAAIKADVDLVELVRQDCPRLRKVAGGHGGEYAGPCPKCGGTDRLHVQGRGLWHCNQCHAGWGDAIEYLRWRDGLSFADACKALGGEESAASGGKMNEKPRSRPPTAILEHSEVPPAAWQDRARAFVAWAQAQLWATPEALTYLREQRGLSEETIRAAGLGWNNKERWDRDIARWGLAPSDGQSVYIPPGWVIPCESSSVLWYVKVRTAEAERDRINRIRAAKDVPLLDKYHAIKGSKKAGVLYGADHLGQHGDVILTEGEFDCLLLRQHVGELAGVATLASAGDNPRAEAVAVLSRFRRIWACYDLDDAGGKGAAKLGSLSRRVRRLWLAVGDGQGKDVTDFWRLGGSLAAWVVQAIGPEVPEQRRAWAEHYLQQSGAGPLLAALRGHYEGLVNVARGQAEEPSEYRLEPRPDLAGDSALWRRLLLEAYILDGDDPAGLYSVLHGFRCYGASLRMGQGGAILEPGEIEPAEYAAWCARYLGPHGEALGRLLGDLAGQLAQAAA